MSARGMGRGLLLAAALFMALGVVTSTVLWTEGTRQASEALRLVVVLAGLFWIARGVRRRFTLPLWAMLGAWYVGSQLGFFLGITRFGPDALVAWAPTSLSLGTMPPAGQSPSVATSMASLAGYLLAVVAVWLGTRTGSEAMASSVEESQANG